MSDTLTINFKKLKGGQPAREPILYAMPNEDRVFVHFELDRPKGHVYSFLFFPRQRRYSASQMNSKGKPVRTNDWRGTWSESTQSITVYVT